MKIIKNIKNKISYPIIFIAFCLFTLTVGEFLPFEFSSTQLSFIFYLIVLIGLPVFSIIEIRKLFVRLKNRVATTVLSIIFILISVFYFFYLIAFCLGNTMCGYIIDKTLFVNSKSTSIKIAVRHYDCGATDSGPAQYEMVKINSGLPMINFVTKIDTTILDKKDWIGIEGK